MVRPNELVAHWFTTCSSSLPSVKKRAPMSRSAASAARPARAFAWATRPPAGRRLPVFSTPKKALVEAGRARRPHSPSRRARHLLRRVRRSRRVCAHVADGRGHRLRRPCHGPGAAAEIQKFARDAHLQKRREPVRSARRQGRWHPGDRRARRRGKLRRDDAARKVLHRLAQRRRKAPPSPRRRWRCSAASPAKCCSCSTPIWCGRAATDAGDRQLFANAELKAGIVSLRSTNGKKVDPDDLARNDLPRLLAMLDAPQDVAWSSSSIRVASSSGADGAGPCVGDRGVLAAASATWRPAGARLLRSNGWRKFSSVEVTS